MFDTGELLLILLVAFLVFGPKRLPDLAKALGKLVYEIREGMRNATVEIKKEYEDLEKHKEGAVGPAGKEDRVAGDSPASGETKDKG
jgi:sec-independent protein translocase protein TatA